MSDGELELLEQWLDEAGTRMIDGDWSLWQDKLSQGEDVTLLGAYGAYVTGWPDVQARFERTAAGYAGGGGHSTHQTIASWIGADLACIVAIERHQTRLEGKLTTFRYRVTHLFRRENGDWKVVLRHADPLATFLGPEFAHFTTQTEDVAARQIAPLCPPQLARIPRPMPTHIGGSRARAVTSDRHAARVAFQGVSEPSRIGSRGLSGPACT